MNDLWSRIQMVKIHYAIGSLSKHQFVVILGEFFKEATNRRGMHS